MLPVTFVLTSCGRFDLLERTLTSFLETNDHPIARWIIIEDSGDDRVLAMKGRFRGLPLEIVVNRPQLGQLRSIDKAYAMVDTEFVFHCEDDWLFTRPILRESLTLLQAFPDVVTIFARGEEGAPRWQKTLPISSEQGVRYRPIDPAAHHRWGNFGFNPGLRRMSHYRLLPGGYAPLGNETAISQAYKFMGLRVVALPDGGVAHIGGNGRTAAPLKRGLRRRLMRWRRSISTRLAFYRWRLSR